MDDGTVSWRELLTETMQRLRAATAEAKVSITDPDLEARWIVQEATGLEGPEFDLSLDELATVGGVERLDSMVERRLRGEPIQYVLGHWSFRMLDLLCDRRVLIPRPETEQVVSHALDALDAVLMARPGRHRAVVVDLGTGTGAIGLAIASERPGSEVWLVDSSAEALAVARANLAGLGMAASHVHIAQGSWWDALPSDLHGRVDLVVTNPPYVADSEPLHDSVARWEPHAALLAGATGLEDYETILAGIGPWLAPGGVFVAEIGATQADDVSALAAATGLTDVVLHADYAGLARTVVAR